MIDMTRFADVAGVGQDPARTAPVNDAWQAALRRKQLRARAKAQVEAQTMPAAQSEGTAPLSSCVAAQVPARGVGVMPWINALGAYR